MNDGADIRLVYAHTESIGSHNHAIEVLSPGFLALVLDHLVQAGVIECGRYALCVQEIGRLLGRCTVSHIDDSGARYAFQYVLEFHQLVLRLAYHV